LTSEGREARHAAPRGALVGAMLAIAAEA